MGGFEACEVIAIRHLAMPRIHGFFHDSQTREIEDPLTAINIPLISHVQKHAFETRQITHAMVT